MSGFGHAEHNHDTDWINCWILMVVEETKVTFYDCVVGWCLIGCEKCWFLSIGGTRLEHIKVEGEGDS